MTAIQSQWATNLVTELATEVQQGFDNPFECQANCNLIVEHQSLDYSLGLEIRGCVLKFSNQIFDDPDACFRISAQAAQYLLDNQFSFDFRHKELADEVTFTGQQQAIDLLVASLLRTHPDVLTRFHQAQSKWLTHKVAFQGVKRLENPSDEVIQQHLDCSWPFIITGLEALKSESQAWTLPALAEKFGDEKVFSSNFNGCETFRDYIAEVEKSEQESVKIYTQGALLPDGLKSSFAPHFQKANKAQSGYYRLDKFGEPQLWLGSVPTNELASALHRDPLDGFLYQIIGRKKLVLFSPDQEVYLYGRQRYNNYQPCWLDLSAPDLNRFPLFRQAQALEIELQAGELLVQPAGWFHGVYCLDSPTMSVSYFLK